MFLLFLKASYDERGTIIKAAPAKKPYDAVSNFSSSPKMAVLIRKQNATIRMIEMHWRSIL